MKKLLLTGASGFLGRYTLLHQQENWDITGIYHKTPVPQNFKGEHHSINLEDISASSPNVQIDKLFHEVRPDAVIHTAAISKAGICEQEPQQSYQINVEASRHLAQLCAKISIPFLFTSTNLIFDGQHAPYTEDAKPCPLSKYGEQKVLAEQAILKVYPNATICRMPLMYGLLENTSNFFPSWLKSMKDGLRLNAFTDEFRTPVYAADAARGLFLLLNKEKTGIWNLGGQQSLSRYNFALKMAEIFGLSTQHIHPLTQNQLKMSAPRPPDVSMDSTKAFALGYQPDEPELVFQKMKQANYAEQIR